MADLFGNVKWPGVTGLCSFSYTRSLGISPGPIVIVVPPQDPGGFEQNGDLTISFGKYSRKLEDCLLDKVRPSINDAGFVDWRLELLDRRWRWKKTGKISGRYNVRRTPTTIIPATKKKIRDLAKLCCEAMQEDDAKLDALDENVFPEVDWDYANPAAALEDLCNSCGCRVGLGKNDVLTIFRVGKGRQLPEEPMEGEATFDPPDLPGKLVIVGARHKIQFDGLLEPVGLDLDGEVKLLKDLSYTPVSFGVKTWEYSDVEHFNGVKNLKAKKLAQQSVFRWYRLKPPIKFPKIAKPIQTLDEILPLNDHQVYVQTVAGREEHLPPQVYGSWWDGNESHKPELDPPGIKRNLDGSAEGMYYEGFQLDTRTGIVKFSQPVYSHAPIGPMLPDGSTVIGGIKVIPATLYLKCSSGLRDKQTRGWYRAEYTRAFQVGGRPVRRRGKEESVEYVRRDDLEYAAWIDWAAGGAEKDNIANFNQIGEEYFKAAEKQYMQVDSGSASYKGWIDIENDGAIQQVSYLLSDSGFAITRVSRNREEPHIAPSYKERRMVEKILLAEARDKAIEDVLAKRF